MKKADRVKTIAALAKGLRQIDSHAIIWIIDGSKNREFSISLESEGYLITESVDDTNDTEKFSSGEFKEGLIPELFGVWLDEKLKHKGLEEVTVFTLGNSANTIVESGEVINNLENQWLA